MHKDKEILDSALDKHIHCVFLYKDKENSTCQNFNSMIRCIYWWQGQRNSFLETHLPGFLRRGFSIQENQYWWDRLAKTQAPTGSQLNCVGWVRLYTVFNIAYIVS